MTRFRWARWCLAIGLALAVSAGAVRAVTYEEQNEALFATLEQVHGLNDEQMARVRAIFGKDPRSNGA